MSDKLFLPNLVKLEDLFFHIYKVPIYQRPYSWGIQETDILYEDIKNSYMEYNEENFNGLFAGTIYLKNEGNPYGRFNEYSIIDGQQRISTLTLLYLTIYIVACERKIENEKEMIIIKDFLWKYHDRENQKNKRLIELGNIDKNLLISIFDNVYSDSKNAYKTILEYNDFKSEAEEKIIENIQFFYNNLLKDFPKSDDLINFSDYILGATQFVKIEVNTDMKKVFEIFESINSKGKQLSQIDLIKSYIFQVIPEEDHEEYLNKWGELISKTNDKLEDYLYTFIKSYIKFYRVSISNHYFKSLSQNELLKYYNTELESKALKKLINDLLSKVKNYNFIIGLEKPSEEFKNSKFKFYYNSLLYLGYQHPKPLLFLALNEYDEHKLELESLYYIFKNSLSFMLSFQTIHNRDSKDAIEVFKDILENSYLEKKINIDKVEFIFKNKFISEGLDVDSLKTRLKNYTGYKKTANRETLVLLAYYESIRESGSINFDNANIILSNNKFFSIDHILPRNPNCKDNNFSYYKDSNQGINKLKLKKDHDFPEEIHEDMEYKLFEERILNKLGNLQIVQKSENSSKGNFSVHLGSFGKFNSFNKILERSLDLSDKLYKSQLLNISNL